MEDPLITYTRNKFSKPITDYEKGYQDALTAVEEGRERIISRAKESGLLDKLCDPFGGTQSRPQPETGWLIERREPNAEWLYVVDWFSFGWTSDSLKAIRFARRQDAEQVLKMIETEMAFATQHQWSL